MRNLLPKNLIFILVIIIFSCSKSEDNNVNNVSAPSIIIYADQVQSAIQKNILFNLNGELPNDIANINWDFGDGLIFYGNINNLSVYHQYQTIGDFIVKAKIIRQDGQIIETSKTITIVNTNIVKVSKITIQNYPSKLCRKFVVSGLSGYWAQFYGNWDESEGFGTTTNVNKYADSYLILSRFQKKPDTSNPSVLIENIQTIYGTTPYYVDQSNNVFDVTNFNVVLSLNAIQKFLIRIVDNDEVYSLQENGQVDEVIGDLNIVSSDFQNNNFIFSNGNGLQIKVDYLNLN